ncbi:hypothetical protein BDA99DRAFT_531776 [Phascolomyces articulosus]|uniref:Uncharacterized protein n=1 Tax=Phascolomyces articulosus TaxID=60185 RepID=A0AAD5PJC4_9FUNG|nr:hypothetical protein BDA99DRAFT_531776 [Phascolomyces articulosus]
MTKWRRKKLLSLTGLFDQRIKSILGNTLLRVNIHPFEYLIKFTHNIVKIIKIKMKNRNLANFWQDDIHAINATRGSGINMRTSFSSSIYIILYYNFHTFNWGERVYRSSSWKRKKLKGLGNITVKKSRTFSIMGGVEEKEQEEEDSKGTRCILTQTRKIQNGET